MKRTVWWYVLLVLISITVPGTAPAAIYLKLDGIDGEATAQGHEKWIEVHSFAFGVSVPTITDGSSGSTRAGKPQFSDFSFTQLQDSSTPKEFDTLVKGKSIATGILDLVSVGVGKPFTYFEYTFSDILLTSINLSSGGDRPIESVTFNYSKIKLDAFSQNETGQSVLASSAEFNLAGASAVPEPSAWALLMAGLLLVAVRGRRLLRNRNE